MSFKLYNAYNIANATVITTTISMGGGGAADHYATFVQGSLCHCVLQEFPHIYGEIVFFRQN